MWFVVLCQVVCPLLASLSECWVVSWIVAGNVDVCDHVVMLMGDRCEMCSKVGFGAALLLFHITVLLGVCVALTIGKE